MLVVIPDVLPRNEALATGRALLAADWVDGNMTSGPGAALAKRNRQLPEQSAAAIAARGQIEGALARNATFLSAALPRTIHPPLFNRYGPGDGFGAHVDNAIRRDSRSGALTRTDLSATLFLSEGYRGGELTIDGAFGTMGYALPAGHMVLYPSTSLHRVTQVTAGERLACVFWLQSLVRDHDARESLFDLDQSVQALSARDGADSEDVLRLTRVYHRLIRTWAET